MWKPPCPSSYHWVWSIVRSPKPLLLNGPTGYESDEKTFLGIVEREATEFKPLGDKIYSYQRVSPSARGKGKAVASTIDLDPESDDVVEYEVYHVGPCYPHRVPDVNIPVRQYGIPQGSGSTTEESKYSSSFTSRVVPTSSRTKLVGNSWYCESPFLSLPFDGSFNHFRYEKRKRRGEPGVATYHFAGYSSLYPFYCFPERIRLRLRCSLAHVDP